MYLQTEAFTSFCCWMCHISALWRAVVVSRRCTNVWLGRVVVYVCQQNRERGKEGGGAGMGPQVPAETWEQETHALHFLSPLYQHLALCYFCALKASDESLATDKCLCFLVFYGAQMRDFICLPFFCAPFLCLFWDATREVIGSGLHYGSFEMGLKDNACSCSSKVIHFYKTLGKGHGKRWIIRLHICAYFARNDYFHLYSDLGNER